MSIAKCVVCKQHALAFACAGEGCTAKYCSEECAATHWEEQNHYVACGVLIDELPEGAAIALFSTLSFKDLNSVLRASNNARYQRYINTPTFKRLYAIKEKGNWEKRIVKWLNQNKQEYLQMWLPTLLETNSFVPTPYTLIRAAWFGNEYVVDMVLKDGRVDPNSERGYALRQAIEKDRLQVVKRLLADPRTLVDPSFITLAKSDAVKNVLLSK